MKLKPIINSLLETDQYKINMTAVILHQLNKDRTTWSFKCRNENVRFTPEMVQEIRDQIDHYCTLRFTDEEIEWLKNNLPWLSEDYFEFLRIWHPFRDEIKINEGNIQAYNDCGLAIEADGTWLNTSFYEIPVLAIVNEVYFAFKYGVGAKDIEFQKLTFDKFADLQSGKYDIGAFSEFGLRRRYSSAMQDWLIKFIVDQKIPGFVGTSNLFLAKKYGVRGVGTMAHEMIQGFQGHHEFNPAYANRFVMKAWVKEFETDNGIYLTDCIKTDTFLLDFNKTYANLFSGVRHDSSDPIAWGEKIINHYKKLNIDPKTKTLLFSDSLNFEKATEIKKHFDGRCKLAFGIGTYLSNPLSDPLNIVMKMTSCNGSAVAKISACDGKSLCRDTEYLEYLKRCIDWRLRHEH